MKIATILLLLVLVHVTLNGLAALAPQGDGDSLCYHLALPKRYIAALEGLIELLRELHRLGITHAMTEDVNCAVAATGVPASSDDPITEGELRPLLLFGELERQGYLVPLHSARSQRPASRTLGLTAPAFSIVYEIQRRNHDNW